MPTAKKATRSDACIKCLIWGKSGSGKSRFALSAPSPLVIDFEKGTRLYADEFDFLVAEVDKTNPNAANKCRLTHTIMAEIINGEYPDAKTLVIDPVTDLMDELESFCAQKYEKMIGKAVSSLNALEKTKWYAYRREQQRDMLDRLKDMPMNLILCGRSKSIWDKVDGKMTPVGLTYDAPEITESLMDIAFQIERIGDEYIARPSKSRVSLLPDTFPVKNWDSLVNAVNEAQKKANRKASAATAKPAAPGKETAKKEENVIA